MKYITLSIEQMKYLEELGLDTSDASMYWEIPIECGYYDYDGYHTSDPEDEASLVVYKTNVDDFIYTPAYTLQDMLDLLDNNGFRWNLNNIEPSIEITDIYQSLCIKEREYCLQSVYNAVIFLLKNNYIKTNKV